MKPSRRLIFPLRSLTIVTLSVAVSATLTADVIYWDGPTNGSWNEVANWSTVPNAATPDPAAVPGAGDIIHFSVTDQTSGRTVNLMTNQAVQGIVSDNLTGTITLRGGNSAPVNLTIGANGINHTRGGLTIGHASEADKVNVVLGASQTWTSSTEGSGAAAIALFNDLSATGDYTLTLDGSNIGSHISGTISDGTGKVSIIKQGAGIWELRGTNTYTGNTQVNEGILRVTNAVAVSPGTTISVADLATFSIRVGSNGLSETEAEALRSLVTFQSSSAFLGLDTTSPHTYTSGISGNHGLMKTSNQTLTLSGNNTYTGDTVIAGGLLAFTSSQAIADINKIYAKAGAGVFAFADTFSLTELEELRNSVHYEDNTAFFGISTQNNPTGLNYDIGMAGEHSFVKAGGNTLTFGGNASNSYTGTTRVASGTLLLSKIEGATAIAGNVLLTGGTLSFGQSHQIADTSLITASGTSSISLQARSETVAGLSLTGGATLTTGNSNSTDTSIVNLGTVTTTESSRITVNSGGRIVADSISLTGTVETNNGGGNILIGGNHSGGVSGLDIGAGGLTMQNRTIQVNGTTTSTFQGTRISLNGTFTGSGENLIRLSGDNSRLAELAMGTGERIFNITGGTTRIELNAAGESLRKNGSGTLTLAGNNIYTGTTTVATGTLMVAHDKALGTTAGGTTVNSGARLILNNGITVTGEALTITGDGADGSTGALRAAAGATATWDGPLSTTGTVARVGALAGGHLILKGAVNASATNLVIRSAGDGTLSEENFSNTVVSLSGTYTGAELALYQGVVKLGASNIISDSTVVNLGVNASLKQRFDLNGFHETIAGLAVTGPGDSANHEVTNSAGTLSTLTLSSSTNRTFSGIVTGNLAIEKQDLNTVTFSGINTYTGDTTISAGAFNIADGGALNGGGSVSVDNGATFNLLGTYLFNIGENGENNSITGAGAANLTGTFNLNLSSAAIEDGNEWSLVGVSGSVNWDGLEVTSTSGDFTKIGDIWRRVEGENIWSFDQNTGYLTLTIPEPSYTALLLVGLSGTLLGRRRKK